MIRDALSFYLIGQFNLKKNHDFNLNQNQIKYALQNSDSFFLYQISTRIKCLVGLYLRNFYLFFIFYKCYKLLNHKLMYLAFHVGILIYIKSN